MIRCEVPHLRDLALQSCMACVVADSTMFAAGNRSQLFVMLWWERLPAARKVKI